MMAIWEVVISLLVGYLIGALLACMEAQRVALINEKTDKAYRELLDEQQRGFDRQDELIEQLLKDRGDLLRREARLSDELKALREQHERTLSALN
jgi:uncharacterized membrane-anchored protein YhcB (DUF1043 family)